MRLGALGDIVHAIPAAAALRAALPDARIDWLVEARHRAILDLVTVARSRRRPRGALDRAAGRTSFGAMRQVRYDVAFDFQGLMKSAVLARASGAARVVGFSIWHLREKGARPFYSDTDDVAGDDAGHVIHKNLHLLRVAGHRDVAVEFPLADVASSALDEHPARDSRRGPFALINPGAAWPNKRWPPARFGEVAAFLRDVRGLPSVVLWGPGEEPLAQAVVAASSGAARAAPPTEVADLLALSRAGRAHGVGRHRSAAHRRRRRDAGRGALRPDQSAAQRSVVGGGRDGLAVRCAATVTYERKCHEARGVSRASASRR